MPRRILALPAAALVALALAAPAAPAKEVTQGLACGASGCRDVTDRVGHDEAALQTGPIDPGPTSRSGFYRIRFRIGQGGRSYPGWRILYVPAQRLTGSIDDATGRRVWSRMTEDSARIFRHAVRGIAPLPARRLPVPRRAADAPAGAPAPEAVAPPAPAERSGDGSDPWPGLALVIPAGGAVALLAGRRRSRRHRDDLHA
jgi:hypothetical protein